MVPFASLTCNSLSLWLGMLIFCFFCSFSLNYSSCTHGVGAVMSVRLKSNIAMKRAAGLSSAYLLESTSWWGFTEFSFPRTSIKAFNVIKISRQLIYCIRWGSQELWNFADNKRQTVTWFVKLRYGISSGISSGNTWVCKIISVGMC